MKGTLIQLIQVIMITLNTKRSVQSNRYKLTKIVVSEKEPKDFENIPSLDQDGEKEFSPSYLLGLKPNDRILEINSNRINSWTDISNQISLIPNQMIQIKWSRQSQIFTDSVKVSSGIFP